MCILLKPYVCSEHDIEKFGILELIINRLPKFKFQKEELRTNRLNKIQDGFINAILNKEKGKKPIQYYVYSNFEGIWWIEGQVKWWIEGQV